MPDLSFGQYELAYNMFSFTVATMFASFVFFILARQQVAPKYRPALVVSALVVGIAGYHYWRILGSWTAAYEFLGVEEGVKATGVPFNEAYRYVDWLLTVPLLLVERVAVLSLPKDKGNGMLTRLIIAAAAMIALGYPGETSDNQSTQMIFFVLSCIPFAYILWVLVGELSKAVEGMNGEVQNLLSKTRTIILITWMFYPIAYLFNVFELSGAMGEVGVQVGYTIADVTAKAFYGVFIYFIAKAKSDAEGWAPAEAGKAAHA